jgi:hypothetical protein
VVAPAGPGRQIRGCEDGLGLRSAKKAEQRFIGGFARDGEDALGLVEEVGRNLVEREANECTNGSQPGIARAVGVVTFLLQVFQEGEDHIGAESVEGNPINGYASLLGDEAQQQAERIPVGGDCVDADLLGAAQVSEEVLEEHW